MGRWWIRCRAIMISFGVCLLGRSGILGAADHDSGAAEVSHTHTVHTMPTESHTISDQITQHIDVIRQADPALAQDMEHQLQVVESGVSSQRRSKDQNGSEAPSSLGKTMGGSADETTLRKHAEEEVLEDPRFQQAFSDPRLRELRQQAQFGELSEEQVRKRVMEILHDHGIEPEHQQDLARSGDGKLEGLSRKFELGERLPEASEQIERLSETRAKDEDDDIDHDDDELPMIQPVDIDPATHRQAPTPTVETPSDSAPSSTQQQPETPPQ